MNKNIEKINSHLWLVNFEYIKAGYIKELKNVKIMSDHATITIEGVMIFNRTDENVEYTDNIANWTDYLMGLKDWQLKENEAFKVHIAEKHGLKTHEWNDETLEMYVKAGHYEYILDFLNKASVTELQRRKIEKKYKRNKLNPFKRIGRSKNEWQV